MPGVLKGAKIAYQVSGAGPPDLVMVPGLISHLDIQWQQTGYRRFVRALERGARLIRLDQRGAGLSDRAGDLPRSPRTRSGGRPREASVTTLTRSASWPERRGHWPPPGHSCSTPLPRSGAAVDGRDDRGGRLRLCQSDTDVWASVILATLSLPIALAERPGADRSGYPSRRSRGCSGWAPSRKTTIGR